jgi:LysM repeat protein
MNFNVVSSRLLSVAALSLACGSLVLSSGCGKSKAAAANDAPPQSLSEPVRPMEEPATPPAIPVSNSNDDYAAQKAGQSRDLPTFIPPSSAQPAPASVVQLDSAPPKGGSNYHTMSKGETLYAISRKYNVKVKDLIAANNFKDPNKLAVGTKVYIP